MAEPSRERCRDPKAKRVRLPAAARRLTAMALVLAALLPLLAMRSGSAAPADNRAQDLIAEVNKLRASYGLEPYIIDPILMAVAKAQNDWRVAAGVTTHIGPDGSRPRDRAIAAGYGGGRTVFISENIVDGTGLTPAEAVQWWTGDDPHLNTMIGPYYRDVGAGAGESGGTWRYTLMAGYVAGGYSAGSTAPSVPIGTAPPAVAPVIISTPRPDGAVVHIVQAGQTLWTIAAVYDVDLETLRQLNGLPETPLLHPGDEILIRAAQTEISTDLPVATLSPRPRRSPTRRPTATSRSPTASPTSTPTPPPVTLSNPISKLLVGVGITLIVLGGVFGLIHRKKVITTDESP